MMNCRFWIGDRRGETAQLWMRIQINRKQFRSHLYTSTSPRA